MVQSIDFYFDFSSPYGYLAALKVPEIETKTGLKVIWHPILLGSLVQDHRPDSAGNPTGSGRVFYPRYGTLRP